MNTQALTAATFAQTMIDNNIVLVDFWATWCGPCRAFAPIFEQASAAHPDLLFAKVDTDAEHSLAVSVGIQSIPTLMAFREGILVFSQVGALSTPALEQVIAGVRGLNMDDIRAEVAETQAADADAAES